MKTPETEDSQREKAPFSYTTGDRVTDGLIEQIIKSRGSSQDGDMLQQILTTAVKLIDDKATRGDLKVINSSLKEMRYAFKVFSKYREFPKVTIFGSARTPEDAPEYAQAREFADRITHEGYMVITGAGDGIMKAGHRGAGREKSFGVNIRLPFEQRANDVIADDPKLVNFKYFFVRKLIFVKETAAVALFPGGFGTLDEGFEVLTLVQTGKSSPLPIVFVDSPGGTYWKSWFDYLRTHLLGRGLISEEDLSLFKITTSVDEAIREIVDFYKNYHSLRYVDGTLVIRVKRPPTPALIQRLNADFKSLLVDGEITSSLTALAEEANEPELAHLPRIVLKFNRRNFGRLRRLIDAINQYA
ncbi:MAG: LOG family protein [Planctomycetes bacterium]|nr:LOG family protein [Planctomycetota bacterium]MBI3846768.1 LOG family protein [Planctomycetota bacterium]